MEIDDDRFRSEMDKLLAKIQKSGRLFGKRKAYCEETDKTLIATIELPGAAKEEINLNVAGDFIEVTVTTNQELENEDDDHYRYVSATRCFYSNIPLPKRILPTRATAEFMNGTLRVEAPKA
jgi:HSP20 family molecular chaperone IbpA